jgi:O-antigen/teichoic acid export membrane protein
MGAVVGLLLSTITGALLAGRLASRSTMSSLSVHGLVALRSELRDTTLRKEVAYTGWIFVVVISMTVLQTSDVIVAKFFLDPATAGAYSGVATVGRTILFASMSVAGVMYPALNRREPAANRHFLRRSLLYVVVIAGSMELVFAVWPDGIMRLLMGTAYVGVAGLLPYVGLFVSFCAVTNLLLMYCVALRRWRVVVVAPIAVGVLAVASLLHHGDTQAIVLNYLLVNAGCLAGVALLLFLSGGGARAMGSSGSDGLGPAASDSSAPSSSSSPTA